MKVIALGDIHGRNIWQKIVDQNKDADKIVFIADYFDSKENISAQKQKDNFRNIIAFKRANMNKVVLLFGNHDFHYLKTTDQEYSGFQPLHKIDIQELLYEAIDQDLIQMCYLYKNILFSHAGVTKTWLKNTGYCTNEDPLYVFINDIFKYQPNAFKFTMGSNYSKHGDDITQSPIWVRSRSLYTDKIDGYIQVVGHTVMDTISGLNGSRKIYTNGMTVETSGVVFIDTLGTSGEYLEINNGKMIAKKINLEI